MELLIVSNPDRDSRLPFLLRLPIGGGMVFRTAGTWPRTRALYCHPVPLDEWPQAPEIVDRVAVRSCVRLGAAIDVVLGGGVAFRGLRPGQRVRYLAADLSSMMLWRARAEAKRRGLDQIEFTEADVEALPFDDASFDLCVSYTGLHCFPDPAAVSEIARVLHPGGTLRGTMVMRRPASGRVRAPVSVSGRVRPERHFRRVGIVAR